MQEHILTPQYSRTLVQLAFCFKVYSAPHVPAGGNVTQYHFRKQFLKWMNKVTISPSNSTPRYTPKRNENIRPYRNLCTDIYRGIIHNNKRYKQTRCLASDKNDTRTMEYYLAIKRNKVHAMTWMNFENIMLSERSHSQKPTYYIFPLI